MGRRDLTAEALADAIDAGDVAAVVALFDGASDADRVRVRPDHDPERSALSRRGSDVGVQAETIAWVATAPASQIGPRLYLLSYSAPEELLDHVVQALGARSDKFRGAFQKKACSSDWHIPWAVLRRMTLTGMIDTSEEPGYIGRLGAIRPSPDIFDRDPGLLDDEVWRLFEQPDAISSYNIEHWAAVLSDASRRWPRIRDRMVDSSLRTLLMDLKPGEVATHLRIAEAIDPTTEELVTRADTIRTLSAGHPKVHKAAIRWLAAVVDAGAIDPGEAAEVLRVPLAATAKNTVDAALKLLEAWAPEHPEILLVVPTALGHSNPAVGQRALRLLRKHVVSTADTDLRAELLAWQEHVPTELRAGVAELCGISVVEAAPSAIAPVEPVRSVTPADVLAADRRLPGPPDPEELVGLVASALEEQGDGTDLERIFTGLAALAGDRTPATKDLLSPVRKRATQMVSDHRGWSASLGVARAVRALTDGEVPPPPRIDPWGSDRGILGRLSGRRRRSTGSLVWFSAMRFQELTEALAAGSPREVLSLPTHRGGRLDPAVLTERKRRGKGLGPFDLRQAELRAGLTGTGPRLEVGPGPLDTMYSRREWGFRFAPDGKPSGDEPMIDSIVDYLCLDGTARYAAYRFRSWWNAWMPLDARFGVSILSARPDLLAAFAAATLSGRMSDAQGEHCPPGAVLDLLAEPTVPIDGPALTLLALALVAPADSRARAVDTCIAGVESRRLDPAALGRQLAMVHPSGIVVLTRLDQPIAEWAAAGPDCRAAAHQFLTALLAGLVGRPNGLHAPLEALAAITGPGADLPDAVRAELADLAGRSTRAGKAAAAVLRASGSGSEGGATRRAGPGAS